MQKSNLHHSQTLCALCVALTLVACGADDDTQLETDNPSSTGESEPDTKTDEVAGFYGERGDWAVGYTPQQAEAGRPALGIWYPATNPDGVQETITYTFDFKSPEFGVDPGTVDGHAIADAPIDLDGGPFPLVIFSHGYSANAAWYSNMPEHYASHGFVVIAPEHTEQDWFQNGASVIQRPVDVTAAIDYAEAQTSPGGAFAGAIDVGNIGVVGHSFGGYTALASGGAPIDMDALNARCATIGEMDPRQFLCLPLQGREAELSELAGLDAPPAGSWPSFADPRVSAIVPIAGDAYVFSEAGLSQISIPMLVMGGTADTGTPPEWGMQLAYDAASSSSKTLVGFEGAEHMFIVNDCGDMPWTEGFVYEELFCNDPVWEKDAGLELIHHFSTAFLRETLKGDDDAGNVLAPDLVDFAGIAYATNRGLSN